MTKKKADLSELVGKFRQEVGAAMSAEMTDTDCMRFLRARNSNLTKATEMAKTWFDWWHKPFKAEELQHLTPATILSELEDPTEQMYTDLSPHSMHGTSKEGHPIYWEKTGLISNNLGKLKKQTSLDLLGARHVRMQELLQARLHFSNSQRGEGEAPLEKMIIVFDLKGLAFSPDMFGINYVKNMFTVDGNFYPERLYKMFMVNAPWYFTAIWALVSMVVDPVTASKIQILGTNYKDQLNECINDDSIPTELGGTFSSTWQWPYPEGSGVSPGELRAYLDSHYGSIGTTTVTSTESSS